MTTPAPAPERPPSERTQRVDRVRDIWVRKLIDLSRRNNLLYYRQLKTGSLDLTDADPAAMTALMAGETVTFARLLPAAEVEATAKSLTEIRRRALANHEERGLSTLFVALHMATWTPTDDGRPSAAPVLLMPIEIVGKGSLHRTGDLQVNLVLLHALEVAGGKALDPDELLGEVTEETTDLAPILDRLRAGAVDVPGFGVDARRALGNFAFQKMAMVKDLRENGAVFAAHDLIAALAGDNDARAAVVAPRRPVDPATFDSVPPDQEFFVMDADSSQQAVVYAVAQGQDGVIQGPPGTGKSQTIVNLVASLAAQGQRVLFVAEKRAALDVVLRRLQTNGLGHLALDLHSADINRRQVMARITEALAKVRESLPVADESVHAPLVARRNQVNIHVNRMKGDVPPSAMTVYDLQGELLLFPEDATATTRWRDADLDRITDEAARQVGVLLGEATGFGDLFLHTSPSPWNAANVPDGAAARAAKDRVAALANREWPALRHAFEGVRISAGLPEPQSIDQLLALASLAREMAEAQQTWRPALFAEDPAALAQHLAPAEGSPIGGFFAKLFNGGYRSALKQAAGLRTAAGDRARLPGELRAMAALRTEWQAAAPGTAVPALGDVSALSAAAADVTAALGALAPVLAAPPLGSLTPAAFEARIAALAADSLTPDRLPRLLELERGIDAFGAGAIVAEMRRVQPPTERWVDFFRSAHLASLLDRARERDSGIAGFNGRVHDRAVEEFCDLDSQRLRVAAARVRRAHAERAIAAMNTYPEQDAIVRREAEKRSRHLPLRRLLAQAPDVLTTLCPCWMASPLTVAQLLDAGRRYFDVVVFDEASQVLPEDAASSLLRGKHAVVAGDSRQLPPTTFFAAGTDDDEYAEEDDAVGGFESLLDMLRGFLDPWTLRWHYRSRDETLIAFSNRFIYEDQLVTFPGPGGPPAVRHELVTAPPPAADEELDSVGAEVDRVVELVLEHAEAHPGETLGVIAMGIKHAKRVQDAIDAALAERSTPALDAFFDQSQDERFFVKNLERVQGDERDAILLTVGYGKDRNGRLPYRFGPLLTAGGERRLNVAVTRARRRVTIVSSFGHHDMDPGRSDARGVELLREYLAYADSGGHVAGAAGPSAGEGALTAFERDVREALEEHGLQLVPHWGESRYRIDFAVRNPDEPERFLLAIECDGPGYQQVPTARDRDCLRRQVLVGLGWRFHRIWSTDWYLRRDEEIDRVLRACDDALAALRAPVAEPDPVPVAAPPVAPVGTAEAFVDAGPVRGARPPVRRGKSIDEYTQHELIALVRWLRSDGRMYTDDELLDAMIPELGFRRRGSRIEAAVRAAILAERR